MRAAVIAACLACLLSVDVMPLAAPALAATDGTSQTRPPTDDGEGGRQCERSRDTPTS